MRQILTVIFTLLVALWLPPAAAGTIVLQTDLTASVEQGEIRLRVDVHNKGDEAAYDLIPTVHLLGNSVALPALEELAPATTYSQVTTLALPGDGHFELPVDVHFKDANGFPLNAFALIAVNNRAQGSAALALVLDRISTDGETEKWRLTLANQDDFAKTVRLVPLTPAAIEASGLPAEVSVEAGQQREQPFSVRRTEDHLDANRYPFYLVGWFTNEGRYYSVATQAEQAPAQPALERLFGHTELIRLVAWLFTAVFIVAVLGGAIRRYGLRRQTEHR